MTDKIEGIVINTRDYREHDAILTVFTKKYGRQNIIVRGVKKVKSKNLSSSQVFTHAYFYFRYHEGSTIHTLTTADIIQSNRVLREQLLKQSIASILCEICETMEDEQSEEVFGLLMESFHILVQTDKPYVIACLFMSCILQMLGIEPYVDGCVRCNRKQGICSISWKDGGFVCQYCYHPGMGRCYELDQLKLFRLISKAKLEHYSILTTYSDCDYNSFLLHYAFFEHYSGIHLKSIKFLHCLQNI